MIIFCTIYYVLSYLQSIPQIAKLLRTKSSNDYSLGMVFMQLVAVISWAIFILTSKEPLIVKVGAVIDLSLLLLVDLLILKYYKFKKKQVS